MDEDISYRQTNSDLSLLKPAIGFLKPYKKQMVIAGFALIFTSALALSFGQGLRVVIDNGYMTTSPELLNQTIIGFIVLILMVALGTYIRFNLVLWIGERISADIRKAVFTHVIDLHPGFFDSNLSGEIQTRITTDTTIIQSVISVSASIALRNTLTFVGGIILMLFTNPKLSMIVFVLIILVVFPLRYFGQRVRKLSRASQDRIANAGAFVGETLSNIKTVHAFNHQDLDKNTFDKHVEYTFDAGVAHVRIRAFMIAAILVLVAFAMGCMLWVGGNDVLDGTISSGQLAAFAFYAAAVAMAVSAISEVVGDLLRAAGAMERLMELLDAKNILLVNTTAPQSNAAIADDQIKGNIQIENLNFHYPSRPDKKAINNLTLNIEAGKSLALVGHSGAGKSTLFDLIMRFYDAQAGSIKIDGANIKSIQLDELRQHMAIVSQAPTIFTGNILENIRYGKNNANMEEVIAASKSAHIHDFIETLPDKYETYLGEAGTRLSGGQKQRLAIARALLKNPEILLLDEATSALDAESEHVVQLALNELMKNRTSIIIAHRLATVINADKIAVMDEGEIIAIGKHHELLKSSPLYARLAELQFNH